MSETRRAAPRLSLINTSRCQFARRGDGPLTATTATAGTAARSATAAPHTTMRRTGRDSTHNPVSAWHMLTNDVDYLDLGHDYFLTQVGDPVGAPTA